MKKSVDSYPVGHWNHLKIVCKGGPESVSLHNICFELNGVEVSLCGFEIKAISGGLVSARLDLQAIMDIDVELNLAPGQLVLDNV